MSRLRDLGARSGDFVLVDALFHLNKTNWRNHNTQTITKPDTGPFKLSNEASLGSHATSHRERSRNLAHSLESLLISSHPTPRLHCPPCASLAPTAEQ